MAPDCRGGAMEGAGRWKWTAEGGGGERGKVVVVRRGGGLVDKEDGSSATLS